MRRDGRAVFPAPDEPRAMAKDAYIVEVEGTVEYTWIFTPSAESFRFRLLRKDSKDKVSASAWCGYRDIAHLGNKYAATEYILPAPRALTPVNAHVIANAFSRSNKEGYRSRAAEALAHTV